MDYCLVALSTKFRFT